METKSVNTAVRNVMSKSALAQDKCPVDCHRFEAERNFRAAEAIIAQLRSSDLLTSEEASAISTIFRTHFRPISNGFYR